MKRIVISCLLLCTLTMAKAQSFDPKTIYNEITKLITWEEFTDNSNNWFIGENDNAPSFIEAGNYYIRLKNDNTTWHRWNSNNILNLDPNRDFVIEIFVSQIMGEDNRGYGLRWGTSTDANDVNSSFCFFISSNGYYRLQNGQKTIQEWATTSAVIKGIDQENKLMIIRKGGITYFYVNYELVHKLTNKLDTGNMIQNIGFVIGGPITISINEFMIGYLN